MLQVCVDKHFIFDVIIKRLKIKNNEKYVKTKIHTRRREVRAKKVIDEEYFRSEKIFLFARIKESS